MRYWVLRILGQGIDLAWFMTVSTIFITPTLDCGLHQAPPETMLTLESFFSNLVIIELSKVYCLYLYVTDQNEFLYMLNLKNCDLIKPSRNQLGDQGFINELYLWERLDLGLQHNTIVHLLQVEKNSFELIWISFWFLYFRIKPTMNIQRISALSFIILPEKNLNQRVRQ